MDSKSFISFRMVIATVSAFLKLCVSEIKSLRTLTFEVISQTLYLIALRKLTNRAWL